RDACEYSGRSSPACQVTRRGMRPRAKRRISCAGQEVGKCTRIIVFISTTRAAILMRRRRSVSNWATRQIERFGIDTRRPHISQYAPAIDLFIEQASVSLVQIGDDEARVGPFGANLDAGDDALDAAPAFGAVEELLEAAYFAVSRRGLEARHRAGLEGFNVPAQCRGRRDAEDVIEAVGSTPVENLGAAVMAVGAQQDLRVGPVGADRAQQTAQEGPDFLAAGPFGGP